MSKRRKSTQQGRSGDPRKRAADEPVQASAEAAPALQDDVVDALEFGHPVDILALASSLITSLDPGLAGPGAELPEPAEFVRMFLGSGDDQLMILGWVVAQLLPDVRLQTEASMTVPAEIVPAWLLEVPSATVVSAWQSTDPMWDTSDIVLSLRIGEADLSIIALLDLNGGAVVKDAFAVPVPLAAVQETLSAGGQTGMLTRGLDLADARTWLAEGIATGVTLEPWMQTDTWPQTKPLLEWALRRCAPGGHGWRPHVWKAAEIRTVVDEFARSAEGGAEVSSDDRELLTDALQRVASRDPLLVSAVKLESGLRDDWATGLNHDLDRLLNLPDLLIAYVRWAHPRRGVAPDDTDAALAAIAHRRAEFVRDVTELLGDGEDEPEDDQGPEDDQAPTA